MGREACAVFVDGEHKADMLDETIRLVRKVCFLGECQFIVLVAVCVFIKCGEHNF